MVAGHYGAKPTGYARLINQFAAHMMEPDLSFNTAKGLELLTRLTGYQAIARRELASSILAHHLADYCPVPILTNLPGHLHWVLAIGQLHNGLFCHDPYGEFMGTGYIAGGSEVYYDWSMLLASRRSVAFIHIVCNKHVDIA